MLNQRKRPNTNNHGHKIKKTILADFCLIRGRRSHCLSRRHSTEISGSRNVRHQALSYFFLRPCYSDSPAALYFCQYPTNNITSSSLFWVTSSSLFWGHLLQQVNKRVKEYRTYKLMIKYTIGTYLWDCLWQHKKGEIEIKNEKDKLCFSSPISFFFIEHQIWML